MTLETATTVIVRNLKSGDWGYLDILELYDYKGQYIVYGAMKPRQPHTRIGFVNVPSRASCFAVLHQETDENILYLVRQLGGQPLILEQGTDSIYILNMGRLQGFWDGRIKAEDGMILHVRKMVDLYQDWKRLGHLPRWFLDLKAKAGSGDGQKLWTQRIRR